MKESWRGRFFEDFEVGDVYEHPLGHTVTTTDNVWFTLPRTPPRTQGGTFMPTVIGVPKEIKDMEGRVSMQPDGVGELVHHGHEVYVQIRHVDTFGGHPAGYAVVLKNMEIMEQEDLPGRSAAFGERLLAELSRLEDLPYVGDVRGKRLLIGIELVEDEESKQPASPDKVMAAISGCQERGLIVGKNGDTVLGFNNVLMVSPPLNITDEDLRFIVQVLRESLNRVGDR